MIEINGKEYEINTDITLGTEKIMGRILRDPKNPKNAEYSQYILKDLLIPTPTSKEINNFRRSDRERIFEEFGNKMAKIDGELKKKRSIL